MASETSLTTMPTSKSTSVMMPGREPTPSMATRMVAYTRSGTARTTLTIPRTSVRQGVDGFVGRAAHNDSGRAITAEMAAPTTAMARVSSRGSHVRGRIDQSGVNICASLSTPLRQLRAM